MKMIKDSSQPKILSIDCSVYVIDTVNLGN